ITGHDVAIGALGIRRGIVAGQFFAGQVSLLNPVDAPEEVLGCPYVIFPGNVGEDDALAQVHAMLAAQTVAAQAGPALGRASFRSPG
ncbi:MAG: hypothetical protein JXA67_07335, partial [Micromonosporaceae bacterium]|nr:hypothetical protein [Micromonosporaceae bacterium]